MKLREIVRYELWYQARRPATWLFLVVLTALLFLFTGEAQIADAKSGGTPVNAASTLAVITLFGSAMALLPIAALVGEAAARDVPSRMVPLMYTAPVSRAAYLGGRFLAALALAALVSAAVPVGILLAVAATDVAPELLGPLRPAYYVAAWLFVGLPNAIVATACAFAAATLARRPVAGFVGSAMLVVASLLCLLLLGLLFNQWTLASLLDPLGITTLSEISRAWTPEAKRTGFPYFTASWLRNRALWLGVSACLLALTHRRFRLAHHEVGAGRTLGRRAAPAPAAERAAVATPIAVPRARRTFGPGTHLRQLAAIARESWRVVVLGWAGLLMLALAALIVATGPEMMELIGVPYVPVTARIAPHLGSPGMWPALLAMLLIAYYAGELVWRDRDAGLGEIAGAAPVPDPVFLLGRVAGLALAMATMQAIVMIATMVVQLRMGHLALEPWLHVRLFLGIQLADTLLFAALAVAVHVVVAHKYAGHAVMLLVYAFTMFAERLGVEHRLLVYAADPGWSYSDMRGFGGSVGPWLTLQLYWAAWTALLLVGAALLWMRGREDGPGARLRTARRRLTRRTLGAAAGAAGLVLTLGAFTFYNTNVLNAYRTAGERGALRAEYEQRYRRHATAAQPLLDGVRLHAELHPARGTAELRGSYRLVNRTNVAIDSLHVTTNPAVATGAMRLDRAASLALSDDPRGFRIYALAAPLRPGDTLRLDFTVRVGRRGFANDGVSDLVTARVAYLRNALLPAIGYQPDRELADLGERRDHGLPLRSPIPSLDDTTARHAVAWSGAERIAFEAVVGTDAAQRAVAPGALRRTWTERGRRYFHYATERPIRNDFALFSADYAVRAGRWRDVAIEVVHHPGHAWNADGMLAGVRASLEHLSAELGPYRYGQARLVEHPGSGTLHAFPINVSFEEGFALLDPKRDPRGLDFPFAIVAHEMAHHWWGDQLSPAPVEGAGFLSESLAWYSAIGVVEHAFGPEHLTKLLALMREAWRPPRPPSDPPLLRASGWFLSYRKGPLAMYALREYVGAAQVNVALRRLLAAHRDARPPLATTRDLYRELEAVTPDSIRPMLHDLLAANTLWELETDTVTATPAAGGMTRLTLDLRARKIVVDTAGVEREVPMHDLVEIGAFADGANDQRGAPVYRRLHRIRSGTQRITITVPATATWAGVDPRWLLFDLDPYDNVARLPREE
jgi:ABC-type transport system involved in multi-copper enzyme maturation permease subunit